MSGWNPRPRTDLANFGRRAYLAGYSDGFYGYKFGSGDEGAYGAFSDYRPGFSDGLADRGNFCDCGRKASPSGSCVCGRWPSDNALVLPVGDVPSGDGWEILTGNERLNKWVQA